MADAPPNPQSVSDLEKLRQRIDLIDQSIVGIAGHHFEYAVHVLAAAQEAGYEAWLVTNRRFVPAEVQVAWRCLPIYRLTFWEAQRGPQFEVLRRLAGLWASLAFRARLFLRHSPLAPRSN